MKKIKVIIADDEKKLRLYIKKRLETLWPQVTVCGLAKNGPEAVDMIEKHKPDTAFLDIRMPGCSGIEVAKKVAGNCRIVFITAYDQYAIQAFENEAIDYILKPFSENRFKKTIKRLQKQIPSMPEPSSPLIAETLERMLAAMKKKELSDYLQWIKARNGNRMYLIPVDDVCYFKAGDKYTVVKTKNGEALIKKSISELSEELDQEQFWRIHRGTIIKVNQIDSIRRSLNGRTVITLKDLPESLTVSRTYSYLFRQM